MILGYINNRFYQNSRTQSQLLIRETMTTALGDVYVRAMMTELKMSNPDMDTYECFFYAQQMWRNKTELIATRMEMTHGTIKQAHPEWNEDRLYNEIYAGAYDIKKGLIEWYGEDHAHRIVMRYESIRRKSVAASKIAGFWINYRKKSNKTGV